MINWSTYIRYRAHLQVDKETMLSLNSFQSDYAYSLSPSPPLQSPMLSSTLNTPSIHAPIPPLTPSMMSTPLPQWRRGRRRGRGSHGPTLPITRHTGCTRCKSPTRTHYPTAAHSIRPTPRLRIFNTRSIARLVGRTCHGRRVVRARKTGSVVAHCTWRHWGRCWWKCGRG